MELYLVDGNSYIYRAYHAIKTLSNSKGLPTNAIYGFTTMLLKIIREKKPDGLCIAFDSPAPTGRHRMFEEYKAQRPEAPKDLIQQIPSIKDVVAALRITAFEMPGFEADDIIATVAKRAAGQGAEVFIVSGDKDMMQVIGDKIKVYDPMKDLVIDQRYVEERFGVPPERIPEVMAIAGDAVDNIPGVKGIGEKTAKELLLAVGSLDELLDHPERIPRERLRKMIADSRDIIVLSKALAVVDTDLPVEVNLDDLSMKEPDWPALLGLFTEFEFKSLVKLVPSGKSAPRADYRAIVDRDQLLEFLGNN